MIGRPFALRLTPGNVSDVRAAELLSIKIAAQITTSLTRCTTRTPFANPSASTERGPLSPADPIANGGIPTIKLGTASGIWSRTRSAASRTSGALRPDMISSARTFCPLLHSLLWWHSGCGGQWLRSEAPPNLGPRWDGFFAVLRHLFRRQKSAAQYPDLADPQPTPPAERRRQAALVNPNSIQSDRISLQLPGSRQPTEFNLSEQPDTNRVAQIPQPTWSRLEIAAKARRHRDIVSSERMPKINAFACKATILSITAIVFAAISIADARAKNIQFSTEYDSILAEVDVHPGCPGGDIRGVFFRRQNEKWVASRLLRCNS